MKDGLAMVLSLIYVVALSVIAREVANDQGWNVWGRSAAWVLGALVGLLPLVRSIALLILCFVAMPFSKALWVGPLMLLALKFLEAKGNVMLRGQRRF